jgi:hypothetical protein
VSDKFNHIDEYFKKHLKDLESETSDNKWKTLYWKLFWKKEASWIIVTIATVILISGLLLIYNFPAPLEFSLNQESQINSNNPENLLTAFDSVTFGDSELVKNKQLVKTTSIESNKKIQKDGLNSALVNPEITTFSSDEISTGEAIRIENPQIKLHPSIVQILNLPIILFEDIELVENDLTEINKIELISNSSKDSAINIVTKDSLSKEFSFGMYILPAYVAKSLIADETYDSYLNLRSESEDNILVLGLGAEFRLSINKMYLQTGLEYSVYGENVRYNFTTNTVDLQNSYYNFDTTWVWIYDPPYYGEPYPIAIDSAWNAVYEKIEMTNEVKNRFQFIEIPIIAGFRTNQRKLNFEIGTGISFGLLISSKGNLPDVTLNSMTELGKSTPFLQKTTFNYILNAGIEYSLDEKWSIILKPNYKQNLKSVFTKDYDISQKYYSFGVLLGIRIKL